MKLTKTYYYQFGSEFTPTSLVTTAITTPSFDFPSPSGEYLYATGALPTDDTAHISISIPFKVQTIHIKNITYTSGLAGNQTTTITDGAVSTLCTPSNKFYINFLSSLVGNRPVGMVHADSQYSANTKQDIKHTFQLPQVINGIYDFSLYDNEGLELSPYQYFKTAPVIPALGKQYYFFDSFSITIEFNSEYEN
jgi:hypothetical protein